MLVIAALTYCAVPMPKIKRIRSATNRASHLARIASITQTAATKKRSAWRNSSSRSCAATTRREKSIAWTTTLLGTYVRSHHALLSTATVLVGSTAAMEPSAWSCVNARTWCAVITIRKRINVHRESAIILKNAKAGEVVPLCCGTEGNGGFLDTIAKAGLVLVLIIN